MYLRESNNQLKFLEKFSYQEKRVREKTEKDFFLAS